MTGDVECGVEPVGSEHAGGGQQDGDLIGDELDQTRIVGRDQGPSLRSQRRIASSVCGGGAAVQLDHHLGLLGLDDVARPLERHEPIPEPGVADLRKGRECAHQRLDAEASTGLGCRVGWLAHVLHSATWV